MTTSANIKGTIYPFVTGNWQNKAWPYGGKSVYTIDELKPCTGKKSPKSRSDKVGMIYVSPGGQISESFTTIVNKKENLWKLNSTGKVGHWRTVNGRRRFYPIDGSGPIPPIPVDNPSDEVPA